MPSTLTSTVLYHYGHTFLYTTTNSLKTTGVHSFTWCRVGKRVHMVQSKKLFHTIPSENKCEKAIIWFTKFNFVPSRDVP